MSALFAVGHVVNQALTACGYCWMDSLRNGICTQPACTKYGVKQ